MEKIFSPRMTAVRRASKQYTRRTAEQCPDCDPFAGGMGWCKKHTPFHTIQHMGFTRWAWEWVIKLGKMIWASVLPTIITLVVGLAFVALLVFAADIGIRKQQLVSCLRLEHQSQTHPDFYLTKTQKSTCDDLDVVIDAPVR